MSQVSPPIWREVRIQTHEFSLAEEEPRIRQNAHNAGALVAFQGMVREFDHAQSLQALFLEHYKGVTEAEIERIMDEAATRWPLLAAQVIHRVGLLHASEPIVLVQVCAEHRAEAFSAAQFIMDYLKTQAPFWKREHRTDGSAAWVAVKDSDQQASDRWA